MDVEEINKRIQSEICRETIEALTDEKLLPEYKKSKSFQKSLKILDDILKKFKIKAATREAVLDEYALRLITPGAKGVIRGLAFNRIVKERLEALELDPERFELCFEKQCEGHETAEKPDWYILEKSTSRAIIGMNQLALWGGGQQLNRADKYLNGTLNDEKRKLLCVVCNEIKIKGAKGAKGKQTKPSKEYKLFNQGFSSNTLCYLNNLRNIIEAHFAEKAE